MARRITESNILKWLHRGIEFRLREDINEVGLKGSDWMISQTQCAHEDAQRHIDDLTRQIALEKDAKKQGELQAIRDAAITNLQLEDVQATEYRTWWDARRDGRLRA